MIYCDIIRKKINSNVGYNILLILDLCENSINLRLIFLFHQSIKIHNKNDIQNHHRKN